MCGKCFNGMWCIEEQKVRWWATGNSDCAICNGGNAHSCAPPPLRAQQLDKFTAGFVKKKNRFTSPTLVAGAQPLVAGASTPQQTQQTPLSAGAPAQQVSEPQQQLGEPKQ
jgi:hypothetical protein